jgi:hypothetical protein
LKRFASHGGEGGTNGASKEITLTELSAAPTEAAAPELKPTDLVVVRLFLLCLGILLAGYAFLGRGFAHLGVPPLYLGEFVLGLGLVATAWAAVRSRLQISRSWLVVLLLAFMVLGAVRTVPYLPKYGTDALRDGTLWGYGLFALMLFVLLDREWVLKIFRLYGRMAIAFLVWGPICYYLFINYTVLTAPGSFIYASSLFPNAPGSDVPILFFKGPDMAVQTAGAIAFLVVGTPLWSRARDFLWRFAAALPASWMVYTTGTITRGGLAAVAASLGVLGVLSAPAGRLRNWAPFLAGAILFGAILMSGIEPPAFTISVGNPFAGPPQATPSGPVATPSASLGPAPSPTPIPTPAPAPTPIPDWMKPRGSSLAQVWENITSILFPSKDSQLEGTKMFRLVWWGKIIDYTFHGQYFWLGKGFGVNLGDDDGFPSPDRTLRSPHNTHMDVLARMGVPGFLLWLVLQGGFAILLLRALLAHRRARDMQLAAVAAWVLAFWVAIMVNTSFDPYIEGPQGGIWFWALVGLGLVVIRLVPRRQVE